VRCKGGWPEPAGAATGVSCGAAGMFIGEKFLITVSGYDSDSRRPLHDIQRIVELAIERARQGSAFLMHIILDHITKFFELTETYRDTVTSLMELHTSMLSNLMANTSNETNTAVRRLTFITTIFMPLTLLAGIGGMSEWSMMTGPANWKIAYPAFLLAMTVIGIANYYLLIRTIK
jgi:Mg2+ and Co2+ transporter CorA